MTRMVVDLPAPLGPRKPVTRPACAVKVTSSTAVKRPYVRVSDSTVIMLRSLAADAPLAHIGGVAEIAPVPTLRTSRGRPREHAAPRPALGRRAHRDLVRRRVSLLLHRQAPPGGRAGRLRAPRRGRGRLPLLRARPLGPRGRHGVDRRRAGPQVRRRPGGRPGRRWTGWPRWRPRWGSSSTTPTPPTPAPSRPTGSSTSPSTWAGRSSSTPSSRRSWPPTSPGVARWATATSCARWRSDAGLPADRVDAVLASEEYAEQVAADIEQARAYGISGVPFFVLDRRLGVSGAQPQEVFAQALRQAHDAAASRPPGPEPARPRCDPGTPPRWGSIARGTASCAATRPSPVPPRCGGGRLTHPPRFPIS